MIRFKHFRTPYGTFTVATEGLRRDGPSESEAYIGVGFCSRNEKNFVKKIGCQIAKGRLLFFKKGDSCVDGDGNDDFGGGIIASGQTTDNIFKILREIRGPQWYPQALRFAEKTEQRKLDKLNKEA